MNIEYRKAFSRALGRDMETKIYGFAGIPVLYIPCQDGRFVDFENFEMHKTLSEHIEKGEICVMSVDTLDKETWSDRTTPPETRIARHEAWMTYLKEEAAKEIAEFSGRKGVVAYGCSLGATHALNLFLRFPETFSGCLALSGIYDAAYGFDDFMNEQVYYNSPVHAVAGLPVDHPFIEKYNKGAGVICVGTGAWEQPETTEVLAHFFSEKGIDIWVDIWGRDVNHDWPWWHKQAAYFFPRIIEKLNQKPKKGGKK